MMRIMGPVNITAAVFIIQISFAFIAATGAFLTRGLQLTPFYREGRRRVPYLLVIILLNALITIGCLILSDEFAPLWHPTLGPYLPYGGVQWPYAILIMFILDILLVTFMVARTGGSSASPFCPMYSILPVLAIFLKEPLGHIALYLALVVVLFLMFLRYYTVDQPQTSRRLAAYAFVSIASLLLATYIGYVTRPV